MYASVEETGGIVSCRDAGASVDNYVVALSVEKIHGGSDASTSNVGANSGPMSDDPDEVGHCCVTGANSDGAAPGSAVGALVS